MQCTPLLCHVIRAIVRKEVCRAVWSLPWPHNTLHGREKGAFPRNGKLRRTRRLKSFPWDALVYGSIMAFYIGKWNKTKQNIRLLRPGSNPGLQSSIKFQCFNPRWKFNIPRSVSQGDCRLRTADCRLRTRGKMQTACKMQTADWE